MMGMGVIPDCEDGGRDARAPMRTVPPIPATSVRNVRRVSIYQSPIDNRQSTISNFYLAHAYASTLGSAPAPTEPVFPSTMMPASEPIDQGPAGRSGNLCPLAASAFFTLSEIRDSIERSPGYMVCGNGEAGKLRVVQRGASIAC